MNIMQNAIVSHFKHYTIGIYYNMHYFSSSVKNSPDYFFSLFFFCCLNHHNDCDDDDFPVQIAHKIAPNTDNNGKYMLLYVSNINKKKNEKRKQITSLKMNPM